MLKLAQWFTCQMLTDDGRRRTDYEPLAYQNSTTCKGVLKIITDKLTWSIQMGPMIAASLFAATKPGESDHLWSSKTVECQPITMSHGEH